MSGKTRTIGLASLLLALLVPISAGTAGAATGGEDRFAPGQNQRIAVYGSPFGKMIYNSSRQAIYQFDRDSKGKSRCYGSCAKLWPPVLLAESRRRSRGPVRICWAQSNEGVERGRSPTTAGRCTTTRTNSPVRSSVTTFS